MGSLSLTHSQHPLLLAFFRFTGDVRIDNIAFISACHSVIQKNKIQNYGYKCNNLGFLAANNTDDGQNDSAKGGGGLYERTNNNMSPTSVSRRSGKNDDPTNESTKQRERDGEPTTEWRSSTYWFCAQGIYCVLIHRLT